MYSWACEYGKLRAMRLWLLRLLAEMPQPRLQGKVWSKLPAEVTFTFFLFDIRHAAELPRLPDAWQFVVWDFSCAKKWLAFGSDGHSVGRNSFATAFDCYRPHSATSHIHISSHRLLLLLLLLSWRIFFLSVFLSLVSTRKNPNDHVCRCLPFQATNPS